VTEEADVPASSLPLEDEPLDSLPSAADSVPVEVSLALEEVPLDLLVVLAFLATTVVAAVLFVLDAALSAGSCPEASCT
jgi:hypothetical protein